MSYFKIDCSFGRRILFMLIILCQIFAFPGISRADESNNVMRSFTEQQVQESDLVKIEDKTKHKIMFIMGALLLVSVLAAASFGIAMAVFGKQVFVAHMVCAVFSVFLAVAHAVTALVWFFPF